MSSILRSDRRIAGLDGVRALAVLSVVLTHYGLFASLEGTPAFHLIHGQTGVRVFFVLSGFLITGLLLTEHSEQGRISYRDFVARRALRIFPLYFLFLAVATLLFLAGAWNTRPAGLVYAWLYVYNFVPPALYDPLIAHTWSLAVEEHFYLLWPLVLLVLAPRPRALLVFIAAGLVASFLSLVVLVRVMHVSGFFYERWTNVAAFSLLVGGLGAALLHSHASGTVVRFFRSNAGLAVAALLFCAPSLAQMTPVFAARVLAAHAALAVQSFGIGAFLIWIATRPQTGIVAALELPPLRYLGTISYGIYIWQGFFLAVSPDRDPGAAWPPSPLWGLLGTAVVAPLSYRFFERRFLALKSRFTPSRRGRSPATQDTAGNSLPSLTGHSSVPIRATPEPLRPD